MNESIESNPTRNGWVIEFHQFSNELSIHIE